jgi:hypothetical protein
VFSQQGVVAMLAVIDDSYHGDGVFVLAGFAAPYANWDSFSTEWTRELSSIKILNRNFNFKMKQFITSEHMMKIFPSLIDVMRRNVDVVIVLKIDHNDIERVQSRMFVPNMIVDWGEYRNKFIVAFQCLIDMLHIEIAKRPGELDFLRKIDFIFDEQKEKILIEKMWANYIANRPKDVREVYGKQPEFRDDKDFPPLQAADLLAWWARKWYSEGSVGRLSNWMFPRYSKVGEKKILHIYVTFDQDQLFSVMEMALRSRIGPEKPIIDLRGLDSFFSKS